MCKNENQKFIAEVRQHVGNSPTRPRMKRTRHLGKGAIIGLALIVSSGLVLGALLAGYYDIHFFGALNLNGTDNPGVEHVYYDDMLLEGLSMEVTTMDLVGDNLQNGEQVTVEHTFRNDNERDYTVSFDMSAMPLEYTDVTDPWYGFTFKVYEHGTTNEITEFNLLGGSEVIVDYFYSLHEDFVTPDPNTFPFDLEINLERIV